MGLAVFVGYDDAMRPHGTALQLEARRRRAVELLAEGKTHAEVARQVKSSVSSVARWKSAASEGGKQALAPKPTPGRPAFLSSAQKQKLVKATPEKAKPTPKETGKPKAKKKAA